MTTTPPPSSSRTTSTSTTTSFASFLESLSQASQLPRSTRDVYHNTLSPTQTIESVRTGGTGETKEWQVEGTKTRELIESVQARDRRRCRREEDGRVEEAESRVDREVEEKKSVGNGSWVDVDSVNGGGGGVKVEPADDENDTTEVHPPVQLPDPHYIVKSEPIDEDLPSFIKTEDEDEVMISTSLEPSRQHFDDDDALLVTSLQEREGLDKSVTRSQSDFAKWLEDTMKLARGDGTSMMETDDALSSIIIATRNTQFGHSTSSIIDAQEEEFPEDSIRSLTGGTESISHFENDDDVSRPFEGDLTFERMSDEEDGEEEKTPVPPEQMTTEEANEGDDVDVKDVDPAHSVFSSPTIAPRTSNLTWKLVTLSLSIGLAYSLHRQHQMSTTLIPTRSIQPTPRFVPFVVDSNSTLPSISHFTTPIPIAEPLPFPLYAIFITLFTAIPTSIHLLRRSNRHTNVPPPTSTRSPSPLIDLNGDSILLARELLQRGIHEFESTEFDLASKTFESISNLACAPTEKAIGLEWLGRTLYVQARRYGGGGGPAQRVLYESAQRAFERSIRMDSKRSSTSRFGLGMVKYRMGDFRGSVKAFESAIRRDSNCSRSFEWLAKSLYRIEDDEKETGTPSRFKLIEQHLQRSIELDTESYTVLSFYGEILHLSGRTDEAFRILERSISKRIDQPQVHLRLAFIANERIEPKLAAKHFRMVIKFVRGRRNGGGGGSTARRDDSCPVSLEAIRGIVPYLSLYFVLDPIGDREERLNALKECLVDYPHDDLVQLLYNISSYSLHDPSNTSSIDDEQPGGGESNSQERLNLEIVSDRLSRRADRYPDDVFVQGLYALSLLALDKSDEAETIYGEFWRKVGMKSRGGGSEGIRRNEEGGKVVSSKEEEREKDDSKRRIAFLVMAFFELKSRRETTTVSKLRIDDGLSKREESPKKQKKGTRKVSPSSKSKVLAEPVAVVQKTELRRSVRNKK